SPPIRLRPSRSSFKKRTSGTSELPFPTRLHPSDFKPAIDREEICAAALSLPRLENSQKALKGHQSTAKTSSKNLKSFGFSELFHF
ncbi:MAG TPA: hypothetical protein VFR03_02140, partial [Thermoanaerobaculia bacterium]|nr:hypothetical protein [Thermoanaerobaculia bacterium]